MYRSRELRRLLKEGYERVSAHKHSQSYVTDRRYKDYVDLLPGFDGNIFHHYIRREGDVDVNVLDLGCGKGLFLFDLSSRFPNIKAFGLSAYDYRNTLSPCYDLDSSMDYRVGDAHGIQKIFGDVKFHMILSVWALRYMVNPLQVLRGCYNLLRQDGLAFFHDIPVPLRQGEMARLREFWESDGIESNIERAPGTSGVSIAIKKSNRKLRLPFSITIRGTVFYTLDEQRISRQPVLQH